MLVGIISPVGARQRIIARSGHRIGGAAVPGSFALPRRVVF